MASQMMEPSLQPGETLNTEAAETSDLRNCMMTRVLLSLGSPVTAVMQKWCRGFLRVDVESETQPQTSLRAPE